MADWLKILDDEIKAGDKMRKQVPKMLSDPEITIDRVKALFAALEQQATDRVEQSDPRSQLLKSEEHNNRYHIKGAYLRDDLVAGLIAHGHRHARAILNEDDLERLVREQARPGDMVVCLGAGTISGWANALPARLQGRAA